ncbi:MAG: PAS domain S-box protein [Flavobacterium sp.]|nr:PAS domain S-box protein [Pedobacter sp.]
MKGEQFNDLKEPRVQALLNYNILDTLSEKDFDSITRLASYICKMPFALITFIDDKRVWVKSGFGLDTHQGAIHESFCYYSIQSDEIFEVKDSLLDPLFNDYPSVTNEPSIRFYAGAPLINPEGFALGSLCVMDIKPNGLNEEQKDALQILASKIISHLELRKQNAEAQQTLLKYEEIYNMFDNSAELHCVMDRNSNIKMINRSVEKLLGYSVSEITGHPIWHFLPEEEIYRLLPVVENGLRIKQKSFQLETCLYTKAGEKKWISWSVAVNGDNWYANGRDITFEKKVVSELEMLSVVASKVDNGVIISKNNNVIWVNAAFERITGYNITDLKGRMLGDVLTGEKTDLKVIKKAREHTKNKMSFSVDLLAYRKDKQPVWISVMNSVILNEAGEIDKEVEVIVDISARKKAEEESEILSLVASKSSTAIVIRDSVGYVTWVNEAFTTVFGYQLDELLGKRLGEVTTGEKTRKDVLQLTKERIENKQPYSVELLVYKKDKTPIWIFSSLTPILNPEGEIERQVEIIVDITERKQAEEQLTLLSLVASKTINGVAISDNNGKVKWVNKAFEDITGYSLKEFLGKRPGDLLCGKDTDLNQLKLLRNQKDNLQSSNIELISYKKDKTRIWLSISNTPTFNSDGTFDQQVEIIHDITERKIIEQELIKAKEEALLLSKAKETFLSVMSHEIRTPLNAVIGITHILIDDNPTKAQLENLKILNFSSQNLLSLINDVLDFTKIETGNMVLEKADVNLKDLVSQTLNTLQFKTVEKGVLLKSETDSRIPLYVKADHTRLYQILINLLGNSVKFTETGYIKLKLDLIQEKKDSIIVGFEISDTGIGIAANKIDFIFDTYTQASADTTRKYGGTGLGLSITKSLIELHNSEITVESKLGKGSTFKFQIEFEKSSRKKEALHNELRNTTLDISVLVVDDNYINRLLAQKVLSKWGIKVDFAEDGAIALSKVQTTHYDVILMDLQMPVMDGLEASRSIRNLPGAYYKNIPIIALTASIVSKDREKIYESGMNDYVMKPFVPSVLHEKISALLNN